MKIEIKHEIDVELTKENIIKYAEFIDFRELCFHKDFAESFGNDIEILKLKGGKVAYELAYYSNRNEWSTQDKDILELFGGNVAYRLYGFSPSWKSTKAGKKYIIEEKEKKIKKSNEEIKGLKESIKELKVEIKGLKK